MLQSVRLTSLLNTRKEKVSTSLWGNYNTVKSYPHLFPPSKSTYMSLLSIFEIHSKIVFFKNQLLICVVCKKPAFLSYFYLSLKITFFLHIKYTIFLCSTFHNLSPLPFPSGHSVSHLKKKQTGF